MTDWLTLLTPCHLLRPEALWLILPLTLLLWLWYGRRGRAGQWQQVCDPALLPHILIGRESKPARWPLLIVGLGGLLAIIALAGPACEQREQPVFRDQSALVIALDLSRSMDAADLKPSRLARARLKLIDILKQRREGQTALLVYAADAFTVSPLTQDAETIIAQISSLDTNLIPTQGSRAPVAVAKAVDLLRQAGSIEGDILLISDGVAANQVEATLAALAGTNHRLSVLAVGTADGAPIALQDGGFLTDRQGAIVIPKLETAPLHQLAREGGGRYAELSADDRDINHLLGRLEQQASAASEAIDLHTDRWQEEGPWLLLLLLPLAALAFRRGYLAVLPFAVLIALPQPSEANDLWLTPDQQAARAMEAGDTAAAAAQFEDPRWRAAAHYRAGDYAAAAEALEGLNDAEALYNKGNALARQGQFEQALAAYEQALKQQPDNEDAEYNRDLIKQLMQQQSQQDQQSSSQDQQGQDQGQGDGNQQQQDQSGQSQQNQQGQQGEQQSAQQQGQGSESVQQDAQSQGSSDQGEQQEAEQAQAAQQDQNQAEQDGEQQAQQRADQKGEDGEGDQQRPQAQQLSPDDLSQDEAERMMQQWLRRIPDDPGGLLRRKFQYQYQQQQQQTQDEIEPW